MARLLILVACVAAACGLRMPVADRNPASHALRYRALTVRMAAEEDEDPVMMSEDEMAKFREAEEFQAKLLAAREERRSETVASFGSLQTKVASIVIVIGAFALGITAFDPSNCVFLAPIKDICIDPS